MQSLQSRQHLTQEADAQAGQALPQPFAQALWELPPPLLLPGAVLLVQREPVHVPGEAGGQVGDGGEGACGCRAHGLVTWWSLEGCRRGRRGAGGIPVPCGHAQVVSDGGFLMGSGSNSLKEIGED